MFIRRDDQGRIIAISQACDAQFTEPMKDQAREVMDFLSNAMQQPSGITTEQTHFQALKHSDTDLIRVIEDLVDILNERGVIRFTDLPQEARSKLMNRKSLRSKANELSNLLDDEDDSLNI